MNPTDLDIEPIERAHTVPAEWYFEERFWKLDREIVQGSWQFVGHTSQLPDPGDYLTADVAGEPVIVVRDNDGALKAHFNVCKHRGGPLAMDRCGHANMLQCKYHGWTYRLDGSLRGVPKFDRSELFDKREFGLTPVHVSVWLGLVFVSIRFPKIPVAEQLAGIDEQIKPLDISNLRHARTVEYDVACNWKVYADNYLEGYHVPLVHPELCQMIDMRDYVTETHAYYSVQYSALKTAGYSHKETANEGDRAFYYLVFPNVMLNVLPGRLQTNVILPVSPRKCKVLFDFYYHPSTDQGTIDQDIVASDKIQVEDVEICERVQIGLESTSYRTGRFSPEMEQGVYHFQSLLRENYSKLIADR